MKATNKNNRIIYFFISLAFCTLFDRYFSNYFSILSKKTLETSFGINLKYMENTGAAFSILQGSDLFLIIFSFVAVSLIVYFIIKNLSNLVMIDLFWFSLLLSGIISNLYERINFGFVTDYFELNFVNFPVFNISDVFINIGVIAIMFILLKKKFYEK